MLKFDYVIVGGGSAGCVLANRLSATPNTSVLLLEAGPSDRGLFTGFWTHLPIGYGRLFAEPRVNWQYQTSQEAQLNNRAIYWPRGKVLGGSSAINAMVWSRGFPSDYDSWNATATGWGWDVVEPVYKRLERWSGKPSANRGHDGPQAVFDTINDAHPLSDHFIRAANEIGFPETSDYNGEHFEGVARYQLSTDNGLRASAARSYIHPVKSRRNLTVITDAEVTALNWQNSNVTRIEGVAFRRSGQIHHASANRCVVLSAGAIGSPLLLQRAGIGNPELLQRYGISVRCANVHVGAHLQDHLGGDAVFKAKIPTLNDELLNWRVRAMTAMRYIKTRRGPLSLSGNHAGGFVKSQPGISEPDLQLYFCPMSYTRAPSNTRPMITPDEFSGFLIGFNPCRPTSRGQVQIQSINPWDKPNIEANYLSTEHDKNLMLKGMCLVRQLANAPALASVIEDEITPGMNVQGDEAMMEHIRQTAWTVFHPSGTCRMGDDARQSVVDARLRVHGVSGLRVVDASIFPNVPSGNTNAPCLMVAERAADLILEDFNSGRA